MKPAATPGIKDLARPLIAPLRVDALFLERGRSVAAPTLDFSRLPFVGRDLGTFDQPVERDRYAENPWLGDSVTSRPGDDHDGWLPPGVHLHWALPHGLTRGVRKPGGARHRYDSPVDYPAVPSRWLVRRTIGGAGARVWLVESDFLWPAKTRGLSHHSVWPLTDAADGAAPPWRYLGRSKPGEDAEWPAIQDGGEHLPRLTAIGPGDPLFAAFYPDCRTAFGLWDDEHAHSALPDGLCYEVLGWYPNPAHDPLRAFLADFRVDADLAARPGDYRRDAARQRADAVRARFGFELPSGGDPAECDGLLLYGRLRRTDAKHSEFTALLPERSRRTSVVVANSGTEAMSAYAADAIADLRAEVYAVEDDWSGRAVDARMLEKRRIEDLLEALHVRHKLAPGRFDPGQTLRRERHERSFTARPGGTRWVIRAEAPPSARRPSGNLVPPPADPGITLPEAVATQLNLLNRAQEVYDTAAAAVPELRRRIYADWARAMRQAYPTDLDVRDWDAVRAGTELEVAFRHVDTSLAALRAHLDHAGRLAGVSRTAAGRFKITAYGAAGCAAKVLATHLKAVDGAVAAHNAELQKQRDAALALQLAATMSQDPKLVEQAKKAHVEDFWRWHLERVPAAPFWTPNDPVVMLVGDAARHTDRWAPAGAELPPDLCSPAPADWAGGGDLASVLDRLAAAVPDPGRASGPRYHPLYLEWRALLHPVRRRGNQTGDSQAYRPDFVTAHWTLGANDEELGERPGLTTMTSLPEALAGRALLSGHGASVLQARLDEYLERRLRAYFDAHPEVSPELRGLDFLRHGPASKHGDATENLLKVRHWFLNPARPGEDKVEDDALLKPPLLYWKDPVLSALDAWAWLEGHVESEGLRTRKGAGAQPALAQALSGFHQQLLGWRRIPHLPIDDPIGFAEQRALARDAIAPAVGPENRHAPLPFHTFHPIRSGDLELADLWLIDTFGQVQAIDVDRVVRSETLADSRGGRRVGLPPRFSQAARLDVRFLSPRPATGDSAGHPAAAFTPSLLTHGGDLEEMNSHPATSPICGWIVPNNLDNSLEVHAADGRRLGTVDQGARWRQAAGGEGARLIGDIRDRHLRRLASHLCRTTDSDPPPADVADLRDAIESALDQIEPETLGHHDARALLTGRPLALVRVAVDLVLQRPPAVRVDIEALGRELQGGARDSAAFERVRVPVRIGEHLAFEDGVVGFWVEEAPGVLSETFYAPQSRPDLDDPRISVNAAGRPAVEIEVAAGDPPRIVWVLLEPHGALHATCGLAPTRVLRVPEDQWVPALRRIGVSFLVAPVITPAARLELALPREPGFRWSWLDLEDDGRWRRVDSVRVVRRRDVERAWPTGPRLWTALLGAGWLRLVKGRPDLARVLPREERKEIKDFKDLKITPRQIDTLLDAVASGIGNVHTEARLVPCEVREGHLVLSPDEDAPGFAGEVAGEAAKDAPPELTAEDFAALFDR